jgi:hypothetical protein
MTDKSLIDASLAEVWEWREQLRLDCEGMSVAEELAYLHQEAENTLRSYGLKLVPLGDGQSKLQRIESSSLNP